LKQHFEVETKAPLIFCRKNIL